MCERLSHLSSVLEFSVREMLNCTREPRNREDPYAVAMKKAGDIVVGHVPQGW